jgi:manganese/iron transport system substrate-binding protein
LKMMKKTIFSIFLLVGMISLAASGCTAAPAVNPAAGGLRVTAVETFLADIAQNVAGERARVAALIPMGVDPHAFEPTPQDVVKLVQAQVIIANGAGFETWLQRTIENSGDQALMIEASNGLKPRQAREGETAEMSNADLVDAICASAASGPAQAAPAGPDAAQAADLPSETGFFTVRLHLAPDGSFGGYLKYATDETGDFQIALGAGQLAVSQPADSNVVKFNKTLAPGCAHLAQGSILTLQKNTSYLLALSGFASPETPLVIGPAGGLHHHDTDPHFWLDPNNAIRYVENIRDGLTTADPQGKDVYAQNAAAYITRLQELDTWIQGQVAAVPVERRLLVTNHESFGYFADRYDFRIVGTIIPSVSTESSPSAQQLARLVDRIKASRAIAVFMETGSSLQLAEEVERETGVKVVSNLYTHSTTAPGGDAPTYIDMLRFDVTAIVNALK